jgi:hypothetical protein
LGFCVAAPFVVITNKVEYAVKKEEMEPAGKGDPCLDRLTGAGYGRDHHIAEELRVKVGKRPLLHGKGDYIGGLVATQIEAVEAPDAAVSDDGERQLPIGKSQVA